MNLFTSAGEVDVNSQWFTGDEIACHCCGAVVVEMEALGALDALRGLLDRPLRVVSGYRCLEHNTAVGGAPRSFHMQGRAFDVSCQRGLMGAFVAAAKEAGFRGIIMYPKKSFVHVDTRDTPYFSVSS